METEMETYKTEVEMETKTEQHFPVEHQRKWNFRIRTCESFRFFFSL